MHAQDPFIYKGRLGYHVVCHDMERGDKSESDGCRFQGYEGCSGQVGLHAYAREILPDGCAAGPSSCCLPCDLWNTQLGLSASAANPPIKTTAASHPRH